MRMLVLGRRLLLMVLLLLHRWLLQIVEQVAAMMGRLPGRLVVVELLLLLLMMVQWLRYGGHRTAAVAAAADALLHQHHLLRIVIDVIICIAAGPAGRLLGRRIEAVQIEFDSTMVGGQIEEAAAAGFGSLVMVLTRNDYVLDGRTGPLAAERDTWGGGRTHKWSGMRARFGRSLRGACGVLRVCCLL